MEAAAAQLDVRPTIDARIKRETVVDPLRFACVNATLARATRVNRRACARAVPTLAWTASIENPD
jgi:hypothetical protein